MSNKAQSWAWQQPLSLASDKFVLVALADNAWDDGTHAWPSLDTLCAKTNLSRRTVYASLQRLETAGFIFKAEKSRQHKPAVYSLNFAREATSAPLGDPQTGNHCTRATTAPVQPLHPEVQLTVSRGATTAPRGATVAPEPLLTTEPTTKRTVSRATTVPLGFEVTSELRAWATTKTPLADIDLETEQWRDHHRNKGTLGKDWVASWRTWMRNAHKWTKEREEKPRGSPRSGGFTPYQNPADQSAYDQDWQAS